MDDLISRQEAIGALKHNQDVYSHNFHDDPIDKYTTAIIATDIDSLVNLPSTQPEERWIPCSERMPDANGMYLVTMMEKAKAEDLGFDLDEIEVCKMRYSCNVGWQIPRHIPKWINDVITDEVIAWMPLPEPYKEGE